MALLPHTLFTTLTITTLQRRRLGLKGVNSLPKGTELSRNQNPGHLASRPMITVDGMGCRGHRGLRAFLSPDLTELLTALQSPTLRLGVPQVQSLSFFILELSVPSIGPGPWEQRHGHEQKTLL